MMVTVLRMGHVEDILVHHGDEVSVSGDNVRTKGPLSASLTFLFSSSVPMDWVKEKRTNGAVDPENTISLFCFSISPTSQVTALTHFHFVTKEERVQ